MIGLSVADASSIKAAGALATVSTAVAFVTLSNTTISDMNGAAVVSIDDGKHCGQRDGHRIAERV